MHGPVLPKNPEFADYLISKAIEKKYGTEELVGIDDKLSMQARTYALKLN